MFDIIIPVGPKDINVIQNQLTYTKKNIIGYRNIYLVCYKEIHIEGCIYISEDTFPFSIETVAKFHGKLERNGWYLQQLLKLYAGIVIPDILDKYLVIDSDTFFIKPTTFIEDNKCLYNYGTEYHYPYFDHMKKLNDNFIKQIGDKSGICHHMIFETKYIKEIFDIVEKQHNDYFYNIFLKMVTDRTRSGASEYELYFNYIILNHPSNIKIRQLDWTNSGSLLETSKYNYVSLHWYQR